MKKKSRILAAGLLLAGSVMACNPGIPTATTTPPALVAPPASTPSSQQCPIDGLSVESEGDFVDAEGNTLVVGLVVNDLETAVTDVSLSIEMRDADGISLLADQGGNRVPILEFTPMLSSLAPGEASPFSYSLPAEAGTPASFAVDVLSCEGTSLPRAALVAENEYLYKDTSGRISYSGDLVNTSAQWVKINMVAGAVLDAGDAVLSADWTFTYSSLLAPAGTEGNADRTPFMIMLPDPGRDYDSWQVYADSVSVEAPEPVEFSIEITNHYFDEAGGFHVVGWLTNSTAGLLNTWLIAGAYTGDGRTLAASGYPVPAVIGEGDRVPFDVTSFAGLDSSDTAAALVKDVSVQTDPQYTAAALGEGGRVAPLTPESYRATLDGSDILVEGRITNTSTFNMGSMLVIIYVVDAQDRLIATNYATLFDPDDSRYSPGELEDFKFTVKIPPEAQDSNFKSIAICQGVSE